MTWGHDERSRMSYLKDGMKMLEEMAIIRGNSIRGRYDEDIAALKDTSKMVTPPVAQVKVRSEAAGERVGFWFARGGWAMFGFLSKTIDCETRFRRGSRGAGAGE